MILQQFAIMAKVIYLVKSLGVLEYSGHQLRSALRQKNNSFHNYGDISC